MIALALLDEVAHTSLDTFTLSIGALTLIATTAAAWGTLRSTVKGIVTDLEKLEAEIRRVENAEKAENEKLEDRLHTIELRFEREKGRNEGSRGKSATMTETSQFERPKRR